MKKSQRLRLSALAAIAEATRTAAEQAEFTTLTALASQHPDASKDSDDTAPAAPAPAAAAPAPAPAPAAAAPTLRGFIASIKAGATAGTELLTARATITAHLATIATHVATIAQRDTQLSALNTQLAATAAQRDTFAAFIGITAAELGTKTPGEITALITAKISAQAVEVVAATGVPVGTLPAQTGSTGSLAEEKTLTLAEFRALSPGEKMKFSTNGGRLSD
jgi:hypothetical protein